MSSKAVDKLRALADQAERAAAAYRLAAAALNGHDVGNRAARGDAVLAEAVALDTARRAGETDKHVEKRGGPRPGAGRKKRAPATGADKARKLAIRRRTVEILAVLNPNKPTAREAWRAAVGGQRIAIGPIMAAGYVRKKAGGYIRTAKPFEAEAGR